MKRFLLPLLAVLALPIAVNSGDLGTADFDKERLVKSNEKSEKLAKSDVIEFNCGSFGSHMKKCTIKFEDGILSVDGSKGIKPSQIKHIYHDTSSVVGLYVYLIYEDSEGDLNHAGFGHMSVREGSSFYRRLITWLNKWNAYYSHY